MPATIPSYIKCDTTVLLWLYLLPHHFAFFFRIGITILLWCRQSLCLLCLLFTHFNRQTLISLFSSHFFCVCNTTKERIISSANLSRFSYEKNFSFSSLSLFLKFPFESKFQSSKVSRLLSSFLAPEIFFNLEPSCVKTKCYRSDCCLFLFILLNY